MHYALLTACDVTPHRWDETLTLEFLVRLSVSGVLIVLNVNVLAFAVSSSTVPLTAAHRKEVPFTGLD